MKETAISGVTGRSYVLADVVRIINYQQAIYYMNQGVKLIDVYPSIDAKTNKPLFVYIFNRKDSHDAYDEWCRRKQNN